MRIAMNLQFWEPRAGGMASYARELIGALFTVAPDLRLVAFVSRELPPDVRAEPWADEVEFVELPVTVTHGPPGNFVRAVAMQWGAQAWLAERRRASVLHGVANIAPLATARVATVVTLHDLIWMRWARTMRAADILGMKLTAIPSVRRATRVIAISQSVKRDLENTLGLDGARIDVVGHGIRMDRHVAAADEAAVRERLGIGIRRVVLCVAQKREHKNLLGLVRAFARLERGDTVLVIPGRPTAYEDEVRAEAASLGVADRVLLPDWVSEQELEALYALAAVFVLPSFEEGFGLPVLEAMARGVPVACSNATSLPEVAGDAAESFDPRDHSAMAAALRRVLEDPLRREELVRRGHERAARFTWEETARRTLAVYGRAVADKRA